MDGVAANQNIYDCFSRCVKNNFMRGENTALLYPHHDNEACSGLKVKLGQHLYSRDAKPAKYLATKSKDLHINIVTSSISGLQLSTPTMQLHPPRSEQSFVRVRSYKSNVKCALEPTQKSIGDPKRIFFGNRKNPRWFVSPSSCYLFFSG